MIGCKCKVCQSNDVRDKRMRASVFLEVDDKNILIDCGPDFRAQMLFHDIDQIDAILLTHKHIDHIGGIDDLRPLGSKKIYLDKQTEDAVRQIQECRHSALKESVMNHSRSAMAQSK